MRITHQLLQIHSAPGPIEKAEYIDLSKKDIVVIERLFICQKLRTLILSGNSIKEIQNVDCCRQLWYLDLSGNKLKSLCGLSRFPVLGSVHLGGNDLDWQELLRISHITILSLSLMGNPKLDSDTHYRRQAVDTLPNVWMLDGRLVTAEERRLAEDFFSESQASSHPVRKKTSENVFVPTSLKNLLVSGVFGEKTTHMMSRFPISYIHNTDMDKKRLSYLIYSIEDDMKLAQLHRDTVPSTSPTPSSSSEQPDMRSTLRPHHQAPNLQSLFESRDKEIEQCNMLLLLILAALEYSIPSEVMHATLDTAKLSTIGDVQCAGLFVLPRRSMLDIASLLLSAATIDRLEKREGGLYNQLYKSLCFTMETVQKKVARKVDSSTKKPKLSLSTRSDHSAWRCLLASEVVHLMCLVPHFFDSLQNNEGLMKMTTVATKNPNVANVIAEIIWKVQTKKGDVWEVYQDIASYLLQATSENVLGKRKAKGHSAIEPSMHRTTSQLIHSTQSKTSPRIVRAMSAGAMKKEVCRRGLRSATTSRGLKEPRLGDMVIISAEQVARIVALPDTKTAVLQIASHSTSLSSAHPDAYFYTDTNGLMWDRQYKCWTKDFLTGDLSSTYLSDSASFATLPTLNSVTSFSELMASPTNTPEHGTHHASRPQSGMSFRSDDLQTIPSEEELDSHTERPSSSSISTPRGIELSPIRVDFGSAAPSSVSVVSENDHQKHVLQQYSINQLRTSNTNTMEHKEQFPSSNQDSQLSWSPRTQALHDLRKSTLDAKETETKRMPENDSFTVPTPQLQFAEMWESQKSVPKISSSHLKPHSCKVIELDKQNLKVEPHMPPPPIVSTPSPSRMSLYSCSDLVVESSETCLPSHGHEQPVLYNAWTVARPNTTTKHSLLTSSRLMQKRQPQAPPVTRQTNQLYGGQGGVGTGTYAVLRTKQQIKEQDVYSNAGKTANKYYYHQQKTKMNGGTNVRKLGRTKMPPNLFIGNGLR